MSREHGHDDHALHEVLVLAGPLADALRAFDERIGGFDRVRNGALGRARLLADLGEALRSGRLETVLPLPPRCF